MKDLNCHIAVVLIGNSFKNQLTEINFKLSETPFWATRLHFLFEKETIENLSNRKRKLVRDRFEFCCNVSAEFKKTYE